jgi:hypothetical protein
MHAPPAHPDAPAFIALTDMGMSPCPVRKMIGGASPLVAARNLQSDPKPDLRRVPHRAGWQFEGGAVAAASRRLTLRSILPFVAPDFTVTRQLTCRRALGF